MAEKIRDNEDRLLESMFRSEPINDDGFSDRIITRIRRRIWLRRLALPIAMLAGAAIAIKPLLQVVAVLSALTDSVPRDSFALPETILAQLPILVAIGCLLIVGIVTFQVSED
jgi:hypothetical protein